MAGSAVMGRRGILWVPVAVAAVVYGGLLWRQQAVERREKRLVSFRAKEVSEVRLTGWVGEEGDKSIGIAFHLKKEKDDFVFVEPYPGVAADQRALKNYLSVLERVPVRRRWEQSDDVHRFGVEPDSPRLTVGLGGWSFDLVVGNSNPVGAEVFVYNLTSKEMALVPATVGALFRVQAMDLRVRRIVPVGDVRGWTLERPGRAGLIAEIRDSEWMVSEGTGPFFPADRSAARGVEQRLVRLYLTDFDAVDRRLSLEAAGLSRPLARLTIQVSSGPATVLTFGRGENPRVLNVAVDGEVRGGVGVDFLDAWPGLAHLKKQALVDFPLASVTRFTVERDESLAVYEKQRGKWYRLGRERRLVDPRGVQGFLLALAKVKIESLDFSGEVEVPQSRYVFFNSEGERVMDLVLGEKKDGVVTASFGGARYRFLLPADETDQWGF